MPLRARAMCCTVSAFDVRPTGVRSRPAGAQQSGPLHRRQGRHGPGALAGQHPVEGPKSLAGKTYEIGTGRRLRPRAATFSPPDGATKPAARAEQRQGQPLNLRGHVRHVPAPCGSGDRSEAGVLSGGEQQMLTLCRTLMGDPDLIIIDEPTEGLAPK